MSFAGRSAMQPKPNLPEGKMNLSVPEDSLIQQGSLKPSAYEIGILAHNQFIKNRCMSLVEDGFLDGVQLFDISSAFIGDLDNCRRVVMNAFTWFDKPTENVEAFAALQKCLPAKMPAVGETPRESHLEGVLVQEFEKEHRAQDELQCDEEPTPVFVAKAHFLNVANLEATYPSEFTSDEVERMLQHLTAEGHIHVLAETDRIYIAAKSPENA